MLFKQVALLPGAAVLAIPLVLQRTAAKRRVGMVVLTLAAVLVLLAGYFGVTGRWGIFFETMLRAPRAYGGDVWANLWRGLAPARLVPAALRVELLPLIVLGAIGLAALLARPAGRRTGAWLIGFAVATYLAVAAPGQFFVHYHQLWLPPLVLAGACGAVFLQFGKLRPARIVPAIAFAGLVWLQAYWFTMSPRQRAAALHPAGFFLDVADVGTQLPDLLRGGKTLFVWCDEPQLYLYAERRPPAAGLWKMHVTDGPLAPELAARTLADLERRAPDYVLSWTWSVTSSDHPVQRWIETNYVPVPGRSGWAPLGLMSRRVAGGSG
jgi:hypothetical protein